MPFLGFLAQSFSFSPSTLCASALVLRLAFLYIWPTSLYAELQIVFPPTSLFVVVKSECVCSACLCSVVIIVASKTRVPLPPEFVNRNISSHSLWLKALLKTHIPSHSPPAFQADPPRDKWGSRGNWNPKLRQWQLGKHHLLAHPFPFMFLTNSYSSVLSSLLPEAFRGPRPLWRAAFPHGWDLLCHLPFTVYHNYFLICFLHYIVSTLRVENDCHLYIPSSWCKIVSIHKYLNKLLNEVKPAYLRNKCWQ